MDTRLTQVLDTLSGILLGKNHEIRLSVTCLLAGGHLLIEDLPGMGKTTLSHALASSIGLSYGRIQFTNDLLPADLLGYSLFNRQDNRMEFQQGPIFAQVVLADEINRASPRTQSALLEAMEERQVSIDGATRKLPEPFFVVATQNPLEQGGTFPLPESQLDRFLMRVSLGYPTAKAERALLEGEDRRQLTAKLKAVMTHADVLQLQQQVQTISASGALLDYIQRLLSASRQLPDGRHGLSPRAGLGLLRAARAWAMLHGREHVLPDDVQAVFPAVASHRLEQANGGGSQVTRQLIDRVPVIG